MPATYSLATYVGGSCHSGAAGSIAITELRTSALNSCRLTEVQWFQIGQAVPVIGFGRPLVRGTAPQILLPFQPDDPGAPPAMTQLALSWSIPPVVNPIFMRRCTGTNNVGLASAFAFPQGIVIPASGSFCFYLAIIGTTGGDFNAVIVE